MKAGDIVEGGIYTGHWGAGYRRIVGVRDLHVVYSTGGDRNHVCTRKTFQRWAARRVEPTTVADFPGLAHSPPPP